MKSKLIRKVICVVLALMMCISPLLTTSATEKKKEVSYEADCPYIFIHGFMGTTVYVDPSDPNSEAIFPPSGDNIKTAVLKGIPSLLKLMITHNWDKFGDEAVEICDILFSPSYLSPDGTASDGSGVRWEWPQKEEITKTSQLRFDYDWRLDPIQTATELNDYINYVLECSESEQVVIECHSYGGVVLSTYAKLFGTSKVKSWCFNSTAVYGETYNGELFTGKLTFDAESLTEYLKSAFEYNENEEFLNGLFNVLYKTRITRGVCALVNWMIGKIGMKKLSKGIIPMFGGWLSIWSMIPDEYIDDAYEFVFDYTWGDDPTDRSGLKAKVDDYNTRIRPYKTETLKTIDREANLYVLARYGYTSMFMTPSWRNESDSVIDLKYASFGATAASHNKKLSSSYLANVDPKYVSPGKNVDASTCLFPEQTWFIKNFTHSVGCTDLNIMIRTLLYSDSQATVDSYDEFPRFIRYNEDLDCFEKDN